MERCKVTDGGILSPNVLLRTGGIKSEALNVYRRTAAETVPECEKAVVRVTADDVWLLSLDDSLFLSLVSC